MKRPLDYMFQGHHIHIARADKPSTSDLEFIEAGIDWNGGAANADVEHLRLTRAAARGEVSVTQYVNACDEYIKAKMHGAGTQPDLQRLRTVTSPSEITPEVDMLPTTSTGLTTLMIICHDGLATQGTLLPTAAPSVCSIDPTEWYLTRHSVSPLEKK